MTMRQEFAHVPNLIYLASSKVKEDIGLDITVVNPLFLTGLDENGISVDKISKVIKEYVEK